jgi:hypothetical protein
MKTAQQEPVLTEPEHPVSPEVRGVNEVRTAERRMLRMAALIYGHFKKEFGRINKPERQN